MGNERGARARAGANHRHELGGDFGGLKMSGRQKKLLHEISQVFSGLAFRSQDLGVRGIPVIKIANIQNKRVRPECTDRLPEELCTTKMNRYFLRPEDTLIAMTGAGSVGKVGKMPSIEGRFLVNQRVAIVRPDSSQCDTSFVYYALSQDIYETKLYGLGLGAGQPNISAKQIGELEVPFPPLPIQQRIAGILSAYDELIENSQRRIKILESMARALYREWFVHFRFPGYEHHPRVPSPLGEIPQGWEVGRLDDILVLQRGFDLPKAARKEGAVPIIAATGVTGFHNEAKVRAPGVVTGRSGTIGEVLYVQEDFWPLNTSLWAKEFPKGEPLYAYYLLSSLDLKQFNSGAAVPTLNRNDIHGIRVIVPPRDLQMRFQDIVGVMLKKSRTLNLKNQNLRRTRDLLLPRLLSRQIKVEKLSEQDGP
ncbi:MAG: restriction endonuclease subunit S [Acidithiobacillus sp.]